MYDCFEFVPKTIQAFESDVTRGNVPCTEEELVLVEALLRKTLEERRQSTQGFGFFGDPPNHSNETAKRNQPFDNRWRHIALQKLYYLLNWIRFKQSRLLRLQFPLDSICGAQFLVMDFQRPFRHLEAAKGMHPVQRLHEWHNREKDNSDSAHHKLVPESFELCDDTLEPIGMLVLELEEDFLRNVNHPFASTVVWPKNARDRIRLPMEMDWTPDQVFSKSKRHFIVGDASEIKELANSLAQVSPKLRAMLCPGVAMEAFQSKWNEDDLEGALECFNSLSGSQELLHPDNVPESSVPSLRRLHAMQLLRQQNIPVTYTAQEERQFATKDAVHDFLRRCGVEDPESVNSCLKAGLLNGHITVPLQFLLASDASGYLDSVLFEDVCEYILCGAPRI